MTINAGVWIDHHKAVVIHFRDEAEEVRQILSDPDKSTDETHVKSSHSPNDFLPEDKRDRKTKIHLDKYYDEVIACLQDADNILVLGPGEAKGEFAKRSEAKKLKGRITHVETADKMTDPEIAAHLRQLLGIGPKRVQTADA